MKKMPNKLEVELDDGETRVMKLLEQAHREKESIEYVRIEYWGDESGVTLTREQFCHVFERIGALPNVKETILHFTDEAPPLPVCALHSLIAENNDDNDIPPDFDDTDDDIPDLSGDNADSTAKNADTDTRKLDFLSLYRVKLSGTIQQFDNFSTVLRKNRSLKTIRVLNCQSVIEDDEEEEGTSGRDIRSYNGATNPHHHGHNQENEEEHNERPCYGMNSFLQALANLPSLESLHLDNVQHLFRDTLEELCRSVNLQKLELLRMGTDMNAHGPAMAAALEANQTSLKELEISSNLKEQAGNAILHMLQVNTTLDTLGLDLDYAEYGEPLAEALIRDNSTIKELHIRLVVQGEENDCNKEERVLANAKRIVEALKENTTLEHLHVNFYYISTEIVSLSLVDLFEELLQKHNLVLAHLSLRGQHRIVNLGQDLHFHLKLNELGRRHLLLGSGRAAPRSEWLETILEHRKDLSVVYYLLSARPTLCTNNDNL